MTAALEAIANVLRTLASVLGVWPERRRRQGREDLPFLHVTAQPIHLQARGGLEHYDDALGIVVSNAGEREIRILKAYFSTIRLSLLGFRIRTALPVFPYAFRSSDAETYELKFGDQWLEHSVQLPAGARALTYLPLARPVPDALVRARRCGRVYLEFETIGKSGTHVVRV